MPAVPVLLLAALKRILERLLLTKALDKLLEFVLFACLKYFASRTTSTVDDELVESVRKAYYGEPEAPPS